MTSNALEKLQYHRCLDGRFGRIRVKGNLQVERYTLDKVKDIPDASTICELVSCTASNVYFEKIIPAGSSSVVVSVVATSKESSPLIEHKAEVDGCKAIKIPMPGPDIGV